MTLLFNNNSVRLDGGGSSRNSQRKFATNCVPRPLGPEAAAAVAQGYGGPAYTTMSGFQCAWDDTAATTTTSGVFNFFPGGRQVQAWSGAAFGPAPKSQVDAYLAEADAIFLEKPFTLRDLAAKISELLNQS